MQRPCILVVLVIGVMMIAASCCAEKITADPNAPGAPRPQSEDDGIKNDPRLAQKITMSVWHERVVNIVAVLSRTSGVTITAGLSDSDWQVRDRKMNICVTDLPLSEVLSSIARVMKFKWSIRGEPGAYTYRLFMDRRDILEAEAAKQREEEQFRQARQRQREKMLDSFAEVAEMSEEELAALKQENPFLYMVGKSGLPRSLGEFFGDSPEAVDAIVNEREAVLGGASLSAAGQQGLLRAIQQLKTLEATVDGGSGKVPEDLGSRMDQVTIRLNENLQEMGMRPEMGFMLGGMRITYPDPGSGNSENLFIPFLDPDSQFTRLIGEMLVEIQEKGLNGQEVMSGREQDFMDAAMAGMKSMDFGEVAPEHPEDPDLLAKVGLENGSRGLSDVLQSLAADSKLNIVSDSFALAYGLIRGGGKEVELRKALDMIGEGFRYNWEKRGSVLEMRDRFWFRKRAMEIPEAWLANWRNTLKKTGTLDLDNLCTIASLTQDQLHANVMSDPDLARCRVLIAVLHGRDFLRLYGALDSTQRAVLAGGGSINLKMLGPEATPHATQLLMERDPQWARPEVRTVDLTLVREPVKDSKQFKYSVTATTDYGMDPLKWELETPKYEEPPKPKPVEKNAEEPAEGIVEEPAGASAPEPAAETQQEPGDAAVNEATPDSTSAEGD